ncbi:hypothetical protein AYJ57_10185 [Salipiger sp. CCB-MM3]|uniref:hypothetical protein n=1 Tax=Roseobacteraceae TaxID=2854170 RepID=UPI00080AA74E|nr:MULTISPECIES: hypothetical protein [Roseobacteraceae]ANT60703.1 hypothetical protein AYJ57_10185 [Salipiger sp. CCB-MM3]MCA0995895.1 hypothetical protein [Alloyangia pacifica]
MFDFSHPFFRPLWLRVAITAVCLGWGLLEIAIGGPGWAVVFLGLGAICAYKLLIAYEPPADGK